MSTNCHLISLSGQGDVHTILINDVAWQYLNNAFDGRPIPDELIQDYVDHQRSMPDMGAVVSDADIEDQARMALAHQERSRSADNDIAMSMGGSSFGGERWNQYGDRALKAMMAFMAKHDLELVGEFEGSIY